MVTVLTVHSKLTNMENTIKNKTDFFLQYANQFVLFNDELVNHTAPPLSIAKSRDFNEGDYLLLKRLPTESDEEFKELEEKFYPKDLLKSGGTTFERKLVRDDDGFCISVEDYYYTSDHVNKYDEYLNFEVTLQIEHYLRSKGYALPWNGITVGMQIEYGWIKLK